MKQKMESKGLKARLRNLNKKRIEKKLARNEIKWNEQKKWKEMKEELLECLVTLEC